MTVKTRARAAGRRFAGSLAQTGLGMVGGGVYFGAHTLISPSIYGQDSTNIPKRSWILPVGGIIGGHLLGMTRVGSVGVGLVGAATAIGIQQIQLGMAIKANAPAPTTETKGYDAGALLEPGDPAIQALGARQEDEAGALWQAPVHEAAGLSL